MKKIGLFLLAALLISAPVPVQAETFYGNDNWHVAFTSDKTMDSNFTSWDLSDAAAGLQPGDDIYLSVKLENQYDGSTYWYMKNDIRKSLEDASKTAMGGAYTYILTYTNANGDVTELFNSDTVGGDTISEAGEGLNAATNALDRYFHLDVLEGGETGQVDLRIALDGETQGNDYQDTLAELELSFAVELDESAETNSGLFSRNSRSTIVKTGDPANPILYIALAGVTGLLLLIIAVWNYIRDRKDQRNLQKGEQ